MFVQLSQRFEKIKVTDKFKKIKIENKIRKKFNCLLKIRKKSLDV
jgi:hypothetical protein